VPIMYIRKKVTDGREYYYLVDGKRNKEGKVKQKVIAYIGDKEKLKELYEKIGEKVNT
jgi:hypothetical protein